MRIQLPALCLVSLSCLSALSIAQGTTGGTTTTESSPAQVRVPNRPSHALFEGGQGSQRTEIAFDPHTQTVTVKLLVQDPHGYFIPNIRRENFAVFENGHRQQNATVEVERAPVTLTVLMEHGGRYRNMNAELGRQVALAAHQFLDEIQRDDRIAFLSYADHLETLAEFSAGHDTPQTMVGDLGTPPLSETNLYDALIDALAPLKGMPGRKAVLLISSGLDTFSQHTFRDVLETIRSTNIPVYVINLAPVLQLHLSTADHSGPYAAFDWKRAETELGQIARASGGRVYSPDSLYDLSAPFDDLMENLRVRYVITYHSSTDSSSAAPRTVRVELVDSKTGAPLRIIDADGHPVRARISVDGSYVPDIESVGTGDPRARS